MQRRYRVLIGLGLAAVASVAAAQITFFENDGFRGRSFTTDRAVGDFNRFGFNDRASSVIVRSGRWELCDDARFGGRCIMLRPGRYRSLSAMGLNDRISSVRPAGRRR
ncbi:MAG TPA: beta/gamma crystallin family protein [Caldimonas sp.]|nr:beta/gamma crystallin family protein [Caldimonas sp.]